MFLFEHPSATGVHRRILVVSWLGWLSAFTTLMLFISLAPLYRGDLHLGDGEVAWVKSLVLGASGLGGVLFGVFGDRRGRRPALVLSLVLGAIGGVLAATASNFVMMAVAAVVAGLGVGGQWASGQTLVGETVPPRLRARFGTISQSGAPLGLMLSTFVSSRAALDFGWRAGFACILATLALAAFARRAVPESDLWLANVAGPADGRAERPGLAELLRPGVRGVFALAFVLTLLCMGNYWFTVSWLREFMARSWNLSIAQSADWFLVFALGSLAGYSLFTASAALIGRRPAFSLFCALMAAGTGMLTVFEGAIRHDPRLVLVFAGLAGVGTGLWSCFGPLYTEIFPTRVRTTAGGVCMNVSRAIQFLAPLLVVLVGGQRLAAGVALAGVFALLAGVTIWFLPDRRGASLR